jgi:type I restriction enzyme S subunit
MKVTVDPSIAEVRFVYAQFCTAETTSRFVNQAMSSGVPHVNLALLREFKILIPPLSLQRRFSESVAPLARDEWLLREQNRHLASMRDLLLPKLVGGKLDVSRLDLKDLMEPVK